MTSIIIKATGASIVASVDGNLTSGMVGVDVKIEYDESWKNLSKTAVFRAGKFERSRENIGTATTVPWEVMRHHGEQLQIGLIGRDADGNIIMPTVWATVGTVHEGASGEIPAAPNPDSGESPSGGGAVIDDSQVSANTTWSSQKISDTIESEFYNVTEAENIGTSVTSTAQNWGFRVAEPVECMEVNPTCEAESGTYTWIRYKTADGSALADGANLVEHSTGVAEIGKAVRFYDVGLDDFIAVVPSSGTLLYANDASRINYANARLAYITKSTGVFAMSGVDTVDMAMGGVFTIRSRKENTASKQWYGKKWACVGDSLTESYVPSSKLYHDYVAETTGITNVNMGVSGTGWKAGEGNNKAFYQRILNISPNADVVTIFGSGNDLGYALGTPTDTGTDTICGCINTAIDNLYSVIPGVSLGIVTPTPWSPYNPANADNKMALLSDAIVQICKNRSIPCLDLYHCSNLRPWDSSFREVAYTKETDSQFLIHPDETGHKLISSRFKNFLESILL